MSETPTYYVLIPLSIVALGFAGVVVVFKAMNQRALTTIEDVVQLAPAQLVRKVVARHVELNAAHMGMFARPKCLPSQRGKSPRRVSSSECLGVVNSQDQMAVQNHPCSNRAAMCRWCHTPKKSLLDA